MKKASSPWIPDREEVIWINCSPHSGKEMKDFHPLLVLSPKSFNQKTGIVIGFPMTTASFNDSNPFAIKFVDKHKKPSYILTHQPKSFDWKARGAKIHPLKRIPHDIFLCACESLNQIIEI